MGRIYKAGKTKVFIGAVSDDEMTLAKFKADTTYKEIDGITNIGGYGPTRQLITSDHVNSGKTKKAVGTINYGGLTLALDRQPKDPGQLAVKEAVKSDDPFNVKVVTPIGKGQFETDYFVAYVMSAAKEFGGANDTQKMPVTFELDDEPLTDTAA